MQIVMGFHDDCLEKKSEISSGGDAISDHLESAVIRLVPDERPPTTDARMTRP